MPPGRWFNFLPPPPSSCPLLLPILTSSSPSCTHLLLLFFPVRYHHLPCRRPSSSPAGPPPPPQPDPPLLPYFWHPPPRLRVTTQEGRNPGRRSLARGGGPPLQGGWSPLAFPLLFHECNVANTFPNNANVIFTFVITFIFTYAIQRRVCLRR